MKLFQHTAFLVFSLMSASVMAKPTVNGNEISWPGDGWYQVQSEDGRTTFCNGSQSCIVPSGVYLVINHSTGTRFSGIIVGNSEEATLPNGIRKEGLRLIWPTSDWYQVQRSDNYVTVCEGDKTCLLSAAGRYNIINLTSGVRYNNVIIDDSSAPVSRIVVEGNTIRWPNDGWYQVQSANGSQTFCNGGRECTVFPGTYLVINHTTGVRNPGIVVGGGELLYATESVQLAVQTIEMKPLKLLLMFTNDVLYQAGEGKLATQDISRPVNVGTRPNSHSKAGYTKRYTCPDGGYLYHLKLPNGGPEFGVFRTCRVGGTVVSGFLLRTFGYSASFLLENMSVSKGNASFTLQRGSIDHSGGLVLPMRRENQLVGYRGSLANFPTKVASAMTGANDYLAGTAAISGFVVEATGVVSNGLSATILTPEPVGTLDNGVPIQGEIVINTGIKQGVLVDMVQGGAESVSVITTQDGATTALSIPRSNAPSFDFLRETPGGIANVFQNW